MKQLFLADLAADTEDEIRKHLAGEWEAANLKTIGGEEREREETLHVANTMGRRWLELNKAAQ